MSDKLFLEVAPFLDVLLGVHRLLGRLSAKQMARIMAPTMTIVCAVLRYVSSCDGASRSQLGVDPLTSGVTVVIKSSSVSLLIWRFGF